MLVVIVNTLCIMTKSKKSSAAEEMLRQSVFSSIHLSSRLKSDVVQLSTPLCSNCGVNKATSKKKAGSYYLSIYTNNSEPFVVWFKKREDPKGILWLRNYTVRKCSDANELELVNKGCPFKCAHKIKLSTSSRTSEWYQLLRDESRRQPSISDEISTEPFLDSSFDDASHRSFFGEEDDSKLELAESDGETYSLSSSADSEDKASLNECSVGVASPVYQNCTSLLSYLKGSKSRNLTTSVLPHLKAKEAKKVKSTSLLISPQQQQQYKLPPAAAAVTAQAHRKPLSACDYNSASDVVERWSWPTDKQ